MVSSKEMKLTVGVVAQERPSASRWADTVWSPIAVIGATSGLQPGAVMREGPEGTTYFMGVSEVYFHRTEAMAYLQNMEASKPGLYVVLRKGRAPGRPPLAWHLHTVTASPYDVQDFSDCGDDIVERVAMPPAIAAAVRDFIHAHPDQLQQKKKHRRNRSG